MRISEGSIRNGYMLNRQYTKFLQGTGLQYCEDWQHKSEIDKADSGAEASALFVSRPLNR